MTEGREIGRESDGENELNASFRKKSERETEKATELNCLWNVEMFALKIHDFIQVMFEFSDFKNDYKTSLFEGSCFV